MPESNLALDRARAAKQKAIELYGDLPSVNGIGLSAKNGCYSVKINLVDESADCDSISTEIDGVPIIVKVIGQIKKQSS